MPQIRVKTGPMKDKVLQVGTEAIVLGRDPAATLRLNDQGVSRNHAQIFRVGEMVFIRDLSSRNGSFVNEERIDEELLREGDRIRVGATQLVFESRRKLASGGAELEYDDQPLSTSLELKLHDLNMPDSAAPRSNDYFRALCQTTEAIHDEPDAKRRFDKVLDIVQEYIPASHAYVFVRDEVTGAVTPLAVRRAPDDSGVPISRSILRRVFEEGVAVLTADATKDERFKSGDSIISNQIKSVLCVPIQSGEFTTGAIYAVNTDMTEQFDQADLQLVSTIGTQLAMSFETARTARAGRELILNVLGRLVSTTEGCKAGVVGHSERVGMLAVAMATEYGCDEKEILTAGLTGMLHDLGKYSGLGKSSAAAVNLDQSHDGLHPAAGAELFDNIPHLEAVLAGIEHHHEYFDGSGVPSHTKGESIPLAARIVAVANAFDRIVYPPKSRARPRVAYALDPSVIRAAFEQLDKEAKTRYDPEAVRALMVAYRHSLFGAIPALEESGVATEPAPAELAALPANETITVPYTRLPRDDDEEETRVRKSRERESAKAASGDGKSAE